MSQPTFNISDPHPEGNQPKNLQHTLELFAQHHPWSSLENAFFHMLNLRNLHPRSGAGTTFDFPTQWTYWFFETKKHWLQNRNLTVCECGFGSGYSSVMFLTATTEGPWTEGSRLIEFDLGIDTKMDYDRKKAISVQYIKETFGSRAEFVWGDIDETIPSFPERNVCDVVLIDVSYVNMKGVKLMKMLAKKSAIVFMADSAHNDHGELEKYFEVDQRYEIDSINPANWLSQSSHRKKPGPETKGWLVGHYI